jgi:hypothetical protein
VTESAQARRRFPAPAVFLLAVFAWRGLTAGVNLWDEAWFLQVVNRVAAGETLYRDVFLGTTPLSVYLALPFHLAAGGDVLGLKVLLLGTQWASALLCLHGYRHCTGAEPPRLLILALAAFCGPAPDSAYSAVGALLALATLAALLHLRDADDASRTRWALAAGAAAGLCFSAKQNYGLLTLALLAAALLPRDRRSDRLPALLAAGGAIAITHLPVFLSGGLPGLLDFGFLGKATYLRSPAEGWWDQYAALLGRRPAITPNAQAWFQQSAYLALPLAAGAWLRAARHSLHERGRLLLLGGFLAAAFLGMYPKSDVWHLTPALPCVLLVAAVSVPSGAPRPWGRAATAAGVLFIAAGLVTGVARTASGLATGSLRPADLPHFRWSPLTESTRGWLAADLAHLRPRCEPGTMILSPRAGFLYLALGAPNPTPYDYPVATAFGATGLARVRSAINAGTVRRVLVDLTDRSDLEPVAVEAMIKSRLVEVETRSGWRCYEAPVLLAGSQAPSRLPAGRIPTPAPPH